MEVRDQQETETASKTAIENVKLLLENIKYQQEDFEFQEQALKTMASIFRSSGIYT